MSIPLHKAGIIGAGVLGIPFAGALEKLGVLRWIVAREGESRKRAEASFDNVNILNSINDIQEIPEFIFLAVSDKQIPNAAKELAKSLGKNLDGVSVAHFSGFTSPEVLSPLEKLGAKTYKAHPYQTFYLGSIESFKGIAWGVETKYDEKPLFELIRKTGGNPVLLGKMGDKQRAAYHISAVFASNYLNALLTLARKSAEEAGIEERDFLLPIIVTTFKNNFDTGKGEFPLTGPIARGDINAVNLHLNALKGNDELLRGYKLLGLITAELAFKNKLIDKTIFEKLNSILSI